MHHWDQRLFGGERQRLALARAFIKRPRWLLMDEATSALDKVTESRVLSALEGLITERNGAIISITHHNAKNHFINQLWQIEKGGSGLTGR